MTCTETVFIILGAQFVAGVVAAIAYAVGKEKGAAETHALHSAYLRAKNNRAVAEGQTLPLQPTPPPPQQEPLPK